MFKKILSLFAIYFFLLSTAVCAQTFKIRDFYQLKDGREWRYTAPSGWKDGDYVSRIKMDEKGFPELYRDISSIERADSELPIVKIDFRNAKAFRHYDATNAAKLLLLKPDGIYYVGEEFANAESFVRFDTPILWFPSKIKLGDLLQEKRTFTRFFKDGRNPVRGTFEITQKIAAREDIKVSAGEFKNCLRVESETFWDLGDGRRARSVNVYHYAKGVGVVNASARFIILNAEGREIINRLVETDLKSFGKRR